MEFTLNVNLNLSEATERSINRLADAFGKSLTATQNTLAYKVMSDEEAAILEAKIKGKELVAEEREAAKAEVIEEAPKTTRTRKPAAPKVEDPKPEVAEKGTGDFVPDAVAIRALAIPLAKAGHGVKEKLTELGYGGIGQLSEGGNEEHIKTFYAWLLEETKSLK